MTTGSPGLAAAARELPHARGCRDPRLPAFFNPATGEWITYTVVAADNGGQLVRFNWRSVPGGVITEHIHPHQEERFTILVGEAHFTLNGREHVAGAGETVVVPAGVPHSERSSRITGAAEAAQGARIPGADTPQS